MINIDKGFIKEVVFSNIMAKVSNHLGMETDNEVAPIIYRKLGLGFESVKDTVFGDYNPHSVTEPIIRSCITTVDKLVDDFAIENRNEILMTDGMEGTMSDDDYIMRKFYAFESEEAEEEAVDGESGIAIVVADLLKEVATATSTQATDLAERVIALTKEDNKSKKEEELSEDEVSSEEVEEDEEGSKGNPFDDDDDDDGNKDDKKKKDDDDEEEKKDGKKDDEGEDKKPKGNPFDEDMDDGDVEGDDSDKGEDKKEEPEKNSAAFENAHCKSIGDLIIDLPNYANFLHGQDMRTAKIAPMLENHSISNYVTAMADVLHGEALEQSYNEFGMESTEFKKAREVYTDMSKKILHSTVGAIIMSAKFDIKLNTSAILNPMLEM